MKFVTSLLLTTQVLASPIHLYHERNLEEAQMLQAILMDDYQIPEELILIRETRDCDVIREKGKLDLCLKNNGDLVVVSVDKEFVNESLKVFRAP
jgi:hypothetical protein